MRVVLCCGPSKGRVGWKEVYRHAHEARVSYSDTWHLKIPIMDAYIW